MGRSSSRRKSDHPLLASLFWREEKRCFVAKFDTDAGVGAGQKLVPREFGKSMEAQARQWVNGYLENEVAKSGTIGARPRVPGILLKDAYSKWRDTVLETRTRSAPSTKRANREHFTNHILPTFGDRTVGDVASDYSGLRLWVRALAGKVSPSRTRNVYNTFKMFLDDAILEKWMRCENPLHNERLRSELPAIPRCDPLVVPIEWVQKLLTASSARVSLGRRARYALAFTSGLREGEMCGLTIGALHLTHEVPNLDVYTARRLERDDGEELGRTKTSTSIRSLPLHPAAVAALREWMESPEGIVFWLGRAPGVTDPLFPSERPPRKGQTHLFARPDSATKLRLDLEALKLPSKVDGESVTMRHSRSSFATYLDRSEGDAETAEVREMDRRRLMGHGLDVTGKHYTIANLKRLASLVSTIPVQWPAQTHSVTFSVPVSVTQVTDSSFSSSRLGDLNPRPAVYENAGGSPAAPGVCSTCTWKCGSACVQACGQNVACGKKFGAHLGKVTESVTPFVDHFCGTDEDLISEVKGFIRGLGLPSAPTYLDLDLADEDGDG